MAMKGIYFTLDALFALAIILIAVITLNSLKSEKIDVLSVNYQKLSSISEDAIQLPSYEKFSDAIENYQYYLNNSVLEEEDLNKSVLEVIAILWASNNTELARNLTKEYFSKIIPKTYNFSLKINDGSNEDIIYNTSSKKEGLISTSIRMISGIKKNMPKSGYIAKVSLKKTSSLQSKYFYFGGYVGDGNITLKINLENFSEIKEIYLEGDISNPFNLYINGNFSGSYTPNSSGNLSASSFIICNETLNPSYCSFLSNNNTIEINFTNGTGYIGGGFLKITYLKSSVPFSENKEYKIYKKELPGINGIINLYDSFYIPGNLNSISIHLHYKTPYTIFLNIGNVTIYENLTENETEIFLNNTYIMQKLNESRFNISDLINKNIPLRLGLKNLTNIKISIPADTVLVTDVSGSMEWCTNGTQSNFQCTDWYWNNNHLIGGRWTRPNCERKIDVAINASKLFVDSLLEGNNNNRISLVDFTNNYGGCFRWWFSYYCYVCEYGNRCQDWNYPEPGCTIPYPDGIAFTRNLTSNRTLLHSDINQKETWWGTCICCGLNRAKNILLEQSNSSILRNVVLLSDGAANMGCSEQNTGNPSQDAVLAGQELCNMNISLYTIGFGSDADSDTLKQIACNESMYYNASNVYKLAEIFQNISNRIIQASYVSQKIEVTGNFPLNNTLYPDSYILINYSKKEISEFGKIPLTQQSNKFNGNIESPKNYSFKLPNLTLLDFRVTSYSSNYWTDRLLVKNNSNYQYVFKLWDFGNDYASLGDPFILNIPVEYLKAGNNEISIDTSNITDTKGGSPDDRIIYTLLIPSSVGYGDTFPKAEGGNKTFESEFGNFTISIGNISDSWDSNKDAIDDAIERLMHQLDIDGNGKVDFLLNSDDIELASLEIGKIPWLFGPLKITLEVWK